MKRTGAFTRAGPHACYFVPADGLVLLGVLDGDPDVVVSFDELGGGVVGGEADGVR